jgi:hypothetical protein
VFDPCNLLAKVRVAGSSPVARSKSLGQGEGCGKADPAPDLRRWCPGIDL